jgi:hypothetical protein
MIVCIGPKSLRPYLCLFSSRPKARPPPPGLKTLITPVCRDLWRGFILCVTSILYFFPPLLNCERHAVTYQVMMDGFLITALLFDLVPYSGREIVSTICYLAFTVPIQPYCLCTGCLRQIQSCIGNVRDLLHPISNSFWHRTKLMFFFIREFIL